jgi:hypothetical protein
MADTDLTGANVKDELANKKKLIIKVAIIVVTVILTIWLVKKFI